MTLTPVPDPDELDTNVIRGPWAPRPVAPPAPSVPVCISWRDHARELLKSLRRKVAYR